MVRLLLTAPLIIFFVLLMVIMMELSEERDNPIESEKIIISQLPDFTLPVPGKKNDTLQAKELRGHYSLINVFASWCISCLAEHPFLMQIKENIPIYGIAWKDEEQHSLEWLRKWGNPYRKIGSDMAGEVIVNLGVTGAPETFLIAPDGAILYRHIGPINSDVMRDYILPRIP